MRHANDSYYGIIDSYGQWARDRTGVTMHYPAHEIAKAHLDNSGPGWRVANFRRFVIMDKWRDRAIKIRDANGRSIEYRRADENFLAADLMQLVCAHRPGTLFDLHEELLYPTEYKLIREIVL